MKHRAVLLSLALAGGLDSAWGFAPSYEDEPEKEVKTSKRGAEQAQAPGQGPVSASSASLVHDMGMALGFGNMTQFARRVQTDVEGSKNTIEFRPYVSAALQLGMTPTFYILPSLGLTFPKSGRDESLTKLSYYLLSEAGLKLHDFLLKAGPGLSMTYIKGKGGEQVLRNGSSTTSFPVPSGNSTSRNVIVALGAEFRPQNLLQGASPDIQFLKNFSMQLQTMIFNLHESTSRAVTYTLALQYHFDINPKY